MDDMTRQIVDAIAPIVHDRPPRAVMEAAAAALVGTVAHSAASRLEQQVILAHLAIRIKILAENLSEAPDG
jgi:hypothetical protein